MYAPPPLVLDETKGGHNEASNHDHHSILGNTYGHTVPRDTF